MAPWNRPPSGVSSFYGRVEKRDFLFFLNEFVCFFSLGHRNLDVFRSEIRGRFLKLASFPSLFPTSKQFGAYLCANLLELIQRLGVNDVLRAHRDKISW